MNDQQAQDIIAQLKRIADALENKMLEKTFDPKGLEIVGCDRCHGKGLVDDPNTTTGDRPCPKCHGSGTIMV